MLTKRNYIAISKIFRDTICKGEGSCQVEDELLEKLADIFESDNPNFNRDKFLQACVGD